MINFGEFEKIRSISNNNILIFTSNGVILTSYGINIAFKSDDGKIYLDKKYYKYSKTTSKHRNMFLDENLYKTEKKIKDGTYILTDLNKDL